MPLHTISALVEVKAFRDAFDLVDKVLDEASGFLTGFLSLLGPLLSFLNDLMGVVGTLINLFLEFFCGSDEVVELRIPWPKGLRQAPRAF